MSSGISTSDVQPRPPASPLIRPTPAGITLPPPLLPPEHWERTAMPEPNEDYESITGSITQSVIAYRIINGRRYHSERGNAQYWASNDERMCTAQEYHHIALNGAIGGAFTLAPLDYDNLRTCLDIGTGTGLWAIEFADAHPDCQVVGTDISPIQPAWVPPNLRFEIEDCTQPWTFATDSIDFVHMRLLYGSIADWEALFAEAYRVCKPGGWVASYEASPALECDDNTRPTTSAAAQWETIFFEGGRKTGRTFELIQHDIQPRCMQRVGFEDIGVTDGKTPIGAWPKDEALREVGIAALAAMDQDIEGYVGYIASIVSGWTLEQVYVYCAHLRSELRAGRYHLYYRHRVVWGRKPWGSSQAK